MGRRSSSVKTSDLRCRDCTSVSLASRATLRRLSTRAKDQNGCVMPHSSSTATNRQLRAARRARAAQNFGRGWSSAQLWTEKTRCATRNADLNDRIRCVDHGEHAVVIAETRFGRYGAPPASSLVASSPTCRPSQVPRRGADDAPPKNQARRCAHRMRAVGTRDISPRARRPPD